MDFSKWQIKRTVFLASLFAGAIISILGYLVIKYLTAEDVFSNSASPYYYNIFVFVFVFFSFLFSQGYTYSSWINRVIDEHKDFYYADLCRISYYFKDPAIKTEPIVWEKKFKEMTFGDLKIDLQAFFTFFWDNAKIKLYDIFEIEINVSYFLQTRDIDYFIKKYGDFDNFKNYLNKASKDSLEEAAKKFFYLEKGLVYREAFGTEDLFVINLKKVFTDSLEGKLIDEPFIRLGAIETIFDN
jgi:hypothetical protein